MSSSMSCWSGISTSIFSSPIIRFASVYFLRIVPAVMLPLIRARRSQVEIKRDEYRLSSIPRPCKWLRLSNAH